jgi:hypothetical protein
VHVAPRPSQIDPRRNISWLSRCRNPGGAVPTTPRSCLGRERHSHGPSTTRPLRASGIRIDARVRPLHPRGNPEASARQREPAARPDAWARSATVSLRHHEQQSSRRRPNQPSSSKQASTRECCNRLERAAVGSRPLRPDSPLVGAARCCVGEPAPVRAHDRIHHRDGQLRTCASDGMEDRLAADRR